MLPCPECVRGQIDIRRSIDAPQLVGCQKCLDVALMRPHQGDFKLEWAPGLQRVETLAPPGSVMSGILGSIGEVIETLPTLPEIPQRVVSMVHDPLLAVSDIADVVDDDPVMSMKVLGMANSAFYSPANEVKDLRTACSLLGLRALANIAHAVASRNLYGVQNSAFLELMEQLWRHGIATAHAAEVIGQKVSGVDQSLLFLAGIMHDVGKLVLLDSITNKYKGATGRLRDSPELIIKVMNRFAPMVGFHVVSHWKLPPEICFSTLYQAQPASVPVAEVASLTQVVALASHFAETCGFVIGDSEVPENIGHPTREMLDIPEGVYEELHAGVHDSLDDVLGVYASF